MEYVLIIYFGFLNFGELYFKGRCTLGASGLAVKHTAPGSAAVNKRKSQFLASKDKWDHFY